MAPNSRPETILEWDNVGHYGNWLPLDYKSGPKSVTICERWREHALSFDYCRVAEELYGFSHKYKLVVPDVGLR